MDLVFFCQEEFLYSAQMMSQITPLGKQKRKFNCCVSDPTLHGSGHMVAEFLKITLIFARFVSSRRALLIFARFYELQALTDDICTFL